MKIQLGIRGSDEVMNHILIKIDDLVLMNKDNLFLAGNEESKQEKLSSIIEYSIKGSRNICWRKCCQSY